MKHDKIIKNLTEMIDSLEKEVPLFGEVDRDSVFYNKLRTLESAKSILQGYCPECGETMVCPKCKPVIEKTNSIIIRYKDGDYNGGYPNALVITPLYTNAQGDSVSCATITGDNFYHPQNKTAGYTYMEHGSIEKTANILANLSIKTWCMLFGFPKNRMPMAKDIQGQLIKFLAEVDKNEM